MDNRKFIIRAIRMDNDLDAKIRAIARFESKTMSKIIYDFLDEEATAYYDSHPEIQKEVQNIQKNEIYKAMKKANITPEEFAKMFRNSKPEQTYMNELPF